MTLKLSQFFINTFILFTFNIKKIFKSVRKQVFSEHGSLKMELQRVCMKYYAPNICLPLKIT